MTYERFKQPRPRETFFDEWDQKYVGVLSEEMKDYIYNKHLVKAAVLNRDNYKCQNKTCTHRSKKLTRHHIKFKKNNGKDTVRNSVTLCKPCHHGYHNGKVELVFPDAEHLPAHIRGHTFKVSVDERIDWKAVKQEGQRIRTEIKHKLGDRIVGDTWFKLTWEQIYILLRWINIPFEDDDD